MSARNQNAILSLLNNDLTLKSFTQNIFLYPDFQVSDIRNIGVKSEKELISFLESIKEQIEFVSGIKDDKRILIELFISFIKRNFDASNRVIETINNDYTNLDRLPVFKLIKLLVDNDLIFNSREKIVFYYEYSTREIDKIPFNEIFKSIGFSKERARQIKKGFIRRFDYIFNFVCLPEFRVIVNYEIDLSKGFFFIDEEFFNFIRKTEEVNFSDIFISRIISLIYKNKFELIGRNKQIVSKKDNYECWSKFYFIDKDLASYVSIDLIINDVQKRIASKIEDDYKLHFQSYLLNFVTSNNLEILNRVSEITEIILLNEFEIVIDSDENIVFKRNTKKQISNYVYKIFEEVKKPLTIYEIYSFIEQKYPGLTKSTDSLRGSLQRDPNLIYFGRSSTYGLKIWENELNIKGGTIRDIAEEYLQNQQVPIHIDEITEYVNKYRNTNSMSILSNLKLDKSKRFVFYKGSCIGLASKGYPSFESTEVESNTKSAKTWDESIHLLNEFTNNNDRLPFSNKSNIPKQQFNSTSAERVKSVSSRWWNSFNELASYIKVNGQYPRATENRTLYIFCYQCYRNLCNNRLHPNQIKALESIGFSFSANTQNNWEDNFNELKDFHNNNQRWPKYIKMDSKESKLYRFCNSIFRSLERGELPITQQNLLEGIGFPLTQGAFTNVWLDNYAKLKIFRQKYPNRWPSARGDNSEKPLYQFCYRNKNKYLEGRLEEFKIKLLNVINFDFYE